jgi:hypothetical protein
MSGRLRGLSIGLAVLAVIGLVTVAGRGVFAQDATPTPSASNGTNGTGTTKSTDEQDFLNAFAAALGVTDQTKIDAAVQTAVANVLADKVSAGELTQEQADVIKAEVADGDYSGLAILGRGGRFGGPHGGVFRGPERGAHGGFIKRHGGDGGYQGGENGQGGNNKPGSTTPPANATPAASGSSISA